MYLADDAQFWRSTAREAGKLSRSFPEAYLGTVQLFNCDILINSCCVTKMTNLDEKFTDEEVNETFERPTLMSVNSVVSLFF